MWRDQVITFQQNVIIVLALTCAALGVANAYLVRVIRRRK